MKTLWKQRVWLLCSGVLFSLLALSAVATGSTPALESRLPSAQLESPAVLLAALVGVEVCRIEAEPIDGTAAAACATVAAPVGDPLCADGGTKCANQGAKCTRSSGSCGTCHDVIVGDATGEHCRGCTCF